MVICMIHNWETTLGIPDDGGLFQICLKDLLKKVVSFILLLVLSLYLYLFGKEAKHIVKQRLIDINPQGLCGPAQQVLSL